MRALSFVAMTQAVALAVINAPVWAWLLIGAGTVAVYAAGRNETVLYAARRRGDRAR